RTAGSRYPARVLGPRSRVGTFRGPMPPGRSAHSVGSMSSPTNPAPGGAGARPVAIVTGGSRGLGRALAHGLAGSGWRVVIDGRDPAALAEAGQGLPADVVGIAGDITSPAHRADLVAAAANFGPLALVVNNAGILGPSPQPSLSTYPIPSLRDVYEANVFAPVGLTQLALPALRAAGGALVMVTSDASIEPYEGWGGYGSAKAAVDQLARVLGVEEPGV